MRSFFRKNKENTNIPEWATFFNDKEYVSFIKEIGNYFDKLSIEYEILDGIIQVQDNFFGFNNLGLVNVAQICKQSSIPEYREVISSHFDALKSNEFKIGFEKIITDFEKVKSYLGVRLYHKDYFSEIGIENTLGYYLTDTIYATLVFDLPDNISSIKPEQVENWSKSLDELIFLGKQNIKEKYPLEITRETLGDFKIWFVQGEHFFVPNILLDLENNGNLLSEKGVLIAAPHRHAVLIYPIKTLEVVKAINSIIPIVYGMNQEGPGSLTNHLYYYKNNTLINLPYEIVENKVSFTPPEEFLEVLNSLQ